MKTWLSGSILCLTSMWVPAWGAVYELPADGSSVVGTDERIKSTYNDTLLDIARRYSLGYEEIIRANPGVDMWLPGEGTDILLPGRRILPPGPREGLVVNLPEHRLYYYPKAKKGQHHLVITYPVSIGKMDWKSPLGETSIVAKQKNPNWYPPESIRKEHARNGDPIPKVVPPGPNNPLVIMERPAPDSQHAGYAVDRERTAAQSRKRRGAGDEKRTICRLGCPCSDDCGGGGGSRWRGTQLGSDPQHSGVGRQADQEAG
jgi:lipoprotein-anchoring transpeptidase ErfK/SrfK